MKFHVKEKSICEEFYCITLFKRNLLLKYTGFLLRLRLTMLCCKQHVETGLDTSKIMILILKIQTPGILKKFEGKELESLLHKDPRQMLAELSKSLRVDLTTVLKHLKALVMIKRQCHWILYQLKMTDFKQCLFMCGLLL